MGFSYLFCAKIFNVLCLNGIMSNVDVYKRSPAFARINSLRWILNKTKEAEESTICVVLPSIQAIRSQLLDGKHNQTNTGRKAKIWKNSTKNRANLTRMLAIIWKDGVHSNLLREKTWELTRLLRHVTLLFFFFIFFNHAAWFSYLYLKMYFCALSKIHLHAIPSIN